MTRYSPGLAGLELMTSEKSAECCAMMCAPFWTLGGLGPSSDDNTPGAAGTIFERQRQRERVVDAENDGRSVVWPAASLGIWILIWPLLKK